MCPNCRVFAILSIASLLATLACRTPAAIASGSSQPAPHVGDADHAGAASDSLVFIGFRLTHDSVRNRSTAALLWQRKVAGGKKEGQDRSSVVGHPLLLWAVIASTGDTIQTSSMSHPLHYYAEWANENGSLQTRLVHLPTAETFLRIAKPAGRGSLALWEQLDGNKLLPLGTFDLSP